MIRFSVNGKCGYPLWDALKMQYIYLDRRDEKMFTIAESSVAIRLEVCPSALVRSNDVLNPVCSGCHMRGGQHVLVLTLSFHCMAINDFYRFER